MDLRDRRADDVARRPQRRRRDRPARRARAAHRHVRRGAAEPADQPAPRLHHEPPADPAHARTAPGSAARGRSRPTSPNAEGFDPAYAVDFWDITNRQDWAACESVQRGMNAPNFEPGPLAPDEDGVYHFVSYVAQAYQGSAATGGLIAGRVSPWPTTSASATSRRSGTPSTATPTGNLYREELMGEEGFSSDSSLLYHRGVPSAIVDSQVWEHRRPDPHAQPPAQAAPPQAAHAVPRGHDRRRRSPAGGWCSATTTSGSGTSSPAPTPRRTTATRSATSACTSSPGSGIVETVFGARDLPDRRLRRSCPRATTHRWLPQRVEPAVPDRGEQPHPPAEAVPLAVRAAARARAVLRARPAPAGRAVRGRGRGRRGAGQAPHVGAASSAPG